MNEPSKWAKEAEAKIRSQVICGERKENWYWEDGSPQQKCVLVWIQQAIDAATAEKLKNFRRELAHDTETIERLRTRIAEQESATDETPSSSH